MVQLFHVFDTPIFFKIKIKSIFNLRFLWNVFESPFPS